MSWPHPAHTVSLALQRSSSFGDFILETARAFGKQYQKKINSLEKSFLSTDIIKYATSIASNLQEIYFTIRFSSSGFIYKQSASVIYISIMLLLLQHHFSSNQRQRLSVLASEILNILTGCILAPSIFTQLRERLCAKATACGSFPSDRWACQHVCVRTRVCGKTIGLVNCELCYDGQSWQAIRKFILIYIVTCILFCKMSTRY